MIMFTYPTGYQSAMPFVVTARFTFVLLRCLIKFVDLQRSVTLKSEIGSLSGQRQEIVWCDVTKSVSLWCYVIHDVTVLVTPYTCSFLHLLSIQLLTKIWNSLAEYLI